MSVWIKCSERMPQSSVRVLVVTDNRWVEIAILAVNGSKWLGSHEIPLGRDQVTHWQYIPPLPEPPSVSTDAPLEHARAAMDAAERKANG